MEAQRTPENAIFRFQSLNLKKKVSIRKAKKSCEKIAKNPWMLRIRCGEVVGGCGGAFSIFLAFLIFFHLFFFDISLSSASTLSGNSNITRADSEKVFRSVT